MGLFKDIFPRLLACMLLEQKIVLVGPIELASVLAFALLGILWPFLWFFPFSPLNPDRSSALWNAINAPVPVLMALNNVPDSWRGKLSACSSRIVLAQLTDEMPEHQSCFVPLLPGHDQLCSCLDELITKQSQFNTLDLHSIACDIYAACNT